MRISDLSDRITLQRKQTTRDERGNTRTEWVEVTTIWASVQWVKGREYFEAAAIQAERTARVTIRHRDNTTTDLRIKYKDHLLDIQSVIDDVKGRRRFMELMCKEVDISV
ncbi:phage head closure protein [Mechercharimyces sp. CAU 1602]|uniref:phage head closure protein n=1 Tax=Mechercharimyces sp. CAU 1602 TaxID=2973933 RepID=UPI002163DE3E|nr:phage head closure protein [Mechercharimyces sp. CAU 1602]MCS1351150.1 phage head closure protein [Mechercharimyces sp. CAU 1602]